MRKAVCFAVALVILMMLVTPVFASKEDDTLIVGALADARTLDPHLATDFSGSCHAMVQMYDTLVRINDKKEIVPHLAESFEQLDEMRYKFVLRKGVKFHNGEELKASDVAFTFKRGKEIGPLLGLILSKIDANKTEVLDDYTLILHSTTRDASFLPFLYHYGGGCILNEKAVREAGDDYGMKPVGTGPFKFVSWTKGDRIVFERFEDYFAEKAGVKNLIVRAIPEAGNRTVELETGDIHVAYKPLPLDVQRIEADPKLQLVRVPDTFVGHMALNTSKKPFDDVRVRRAVKLAIDMNALVNAVYRGTASAARSIIPPAIPYYDSTLPPPEYNVEEAKKLLAEAGYANGCSATLYVQDSQDRIDVATIVQNYLKQVGIDLTIQVFESGAYWTQIAENTYDMNVGGWTTAVPDPDYSVFGMHHSTEAKSGLNWSRLQDQRIDDLIMGARQAMDPTERAVIYKELQHYLRYEAIPYLYVNNGEWIVGLNKDVKGFVPQPTGYQPLYNVYFE